MKAHDRKQAFADARLYLVAPDLPLDVLDAVIGAGVDVVQLRMKDAEASDIIDIGDGFARVCEERNIPFILNDRADIALALAADGVHLGQDDLPPIVAREIVGGDMIIGRSTHSTADIVRGLEEYGDGLADYIAVGPVHETPTKQGRPAVGLELVEFAAGRVEVPWFAIGGINAANVADVKTAGASRIVVVRAITDADDPIAAAEDLRARLA